MTKKRKTISFSQKIRATMVNNSLKLANVQPILDLCGSLILQIGEASGPVLMVEIQMRLIGQFSEPVRNKIAELVQAHPRKKMQSKKYWECDPEFLTQAIAEVFDKDLSPESQNEILEYSKIRGTFFHAKFINLMSLLGAKAYGRTTVHFGGRTLRNIVESYDIEESLKLIKKEGGCAKIRQKASKVISILENIIKKLGV